MQAKLLVISAASFPPFEMLRRILLWISWLQYSVTGENLKELVKQTFLLLQ